MADKCRDGQQKLGGFEKWHFYLVIESLPIMLRLTVLSLECALSRYLWTTSHTIAEIILAITLPGVMICLPHSRNDDLLQLPLQAPSIIARAVIKYLSHSHTTISLSL